jgi:hypothetical protein
MAKECPVCRLLSPDTAERCDCGYDFATGHIAAFYANPSNAEIRAERGMTVAQVGVRTMKRGIWPLAGALGLLGYAVYQAATDPIDIRPDGQLTRDVADQLTAHLRHSLFAVYSLVLLASALLFLLRGLMQYRRGKRMERERSVTGTR